MALASSFCLLPCLAKTTEIKTRLQVRAKNRASADAEKKERERDGKVVGGGNEMSKPRVERKWMEDVVVSKDLELLWDDGYRTKTINDYLDGAAEMIKPDGGPPRWFCPLECGESLKGSPVLLFLPGIDGVGLGLVLHHKALGKVFDVRCFHIPVHDRTPFQGLVKLVEETVRLEYSINPDKPIYLVGDSFGCCLALAVAALNPKIDLVLVLANPATSFGRSQLRSIFPALEALPNELQMTVSLLLSSLLCNPFKMVMANVEYKLPPSLKLEQMSGNFGAFLHRLSVVTDIFPMEMLLWKLQLIKSGAAYANSRLHAVKAEVLVLASGNDNVLPSGDEAERLKSSLKNCIFRYFKDNGHALLMEAGISLLTIIKCTEKYRRSRRHDHILDFIPPSMLEVRTMFGEVSGMFQWAVGSAMFSTLEDGKIVRGLVGVPDEGPVLLVGYHMMWGMELYQLFEQFIKEKKVLLRGVAHPLLFSEDFGRPLDINILDWFKVMGALPVTGSNIFKLLARKSHVLLYPGGAREAFHNKGEEYKLFWPDQPEFVRMAARFGATIVPFGVVGEDDVARHVLDYHDLVKLPFFNGYIKETQQKVGRVRGKSEGEVGNPEVFFPVPFPKYPGRLYYLFGKPIRTQGMKEILNDREKANQIYLQIKSDVEQSLAYLLKKREEDPYRGLLDRTVYRAMFSSHDEVPTFDP